VLTLQKADKRWSLFRNKPKNGSPATVSISTANQPIENLLTKEWLLTNERGSYASSTIAGCNTRGYHGLLIGSLNPPVNRIMALANCLEMVIFEGKVFNLSTFEFSNKFAPAGFTLLKQFRRDIAAHFDYELGELKLTKSVYLLRDTDTVALVYGFTSVQEPVEFVLRPFVGLRDFHTLQKSHAPLCSRRLGRSVLVRHSIANSCELFLSCPSAHFEKDRQWWFNFVYRNNRERGQDFIEDLWTPGFFKCRIVPGTPCGETPTKIVLWANLSPPWARCKPEELANLDIEAVREDLLRHQENIKRKANSMLDTQCSMRVSRIGNRVSSFEALSLTTDSFIAKRQINPVREQKQKVSNGVNHTHRTTILAGYPWFADWGRDAFIALPGLLLATGRFEEAKSVLTTFATAADEGMIPNRFDDRSGPGDSLPSTTYFNSVDASLWFINAAFQYLQATDDSKTFDQELMPTIRWIIESYHQGTRFDIHADADGLITAGNDQTQLTWMDAKFEGVAFTPRFGKAVEVNALWYNSLCLLAQFYKDRDIEAVEHYQSMAEKVRASFCELFWNESKGYLNDCILPDGSVDESLRPNQIFAVSLPFSPLSDRQQKSVVNAVKNQLLTPYGLRTLNVQDSRYKGVYIGPQQQRDEAYHQGTVWPYLMGPFVESFLKVNGFSRKSKKKAAEFIQPLLQHLTEDGCLGSVSEIFDGDPPHKPKGCIAQAWSVAELIRAYQLINS
jgi:glycogen debranching enzyme